MVLLGSAALGVTGAAVEAVGCTTGAVIIIVLAGTLPWGVKGFAAGCSFTTGVPHDEQN